MKEKENILQPFKKANPHSEAEDEIVDKAEELATQRYHTDFDELPRQVQYELFVEAERWYNEKLVSQAEHLRDLKENR